MKTIKLYDGMRMTTKNETTEYPDMTAFDHIKCDEATRIEIIRNLMAFHYVDFRPMGYDLQLELY